MQKKAINCIVSGRVQGVGFRMSTSQQCKLLGLKGWVRNLDNGNVEVYFNTPDKNKRYRFFALKLPDTESLYKATHTFKEPGDWMIEIYIDDKNISENFIFFVSVNNPAITAFKHGYLVMLLVVLFIVVAFVKLSFEAKSKK